MQVDFPDSGNAATQMNLLQQSRHHHAEFAQKPEVAQGVIRAAFR